MPHIHQFIQRYPPALGGSEAYFARLSEFLVRQGHSVSVWTTNAIALEAFWKPKQETIPAGITEQNGVQVRRYAPKLWPGRRYLLKALTYFPHRLVQALAMPCNPICLEMWQDAGNYPGPLDVVHASAFPYAWPIACARRLARRRAVPLVVTPFLHLGDLTDPDNAVRRAYLAPPLRQFLHSADWILTQTPTEKEVVCSLGIPAERVILQGLGVDSTECTGGVRERGRRAWGIPPDEVVIGHLANLSREKGTVDLLAASTGLAARLLLAGPMMPNFRAVWERQPTEVRNRVTLTGPLSTEQRRDFFASIDIFALPSQSDSFGLVLLEAWANGIPNVVYNAGGPADLIHDGKDGRIVPCGDIPQLRKALRELLAHEPTRRQMGQAGKFRLSGDFAWPDKLAIAERTLLAGLTPTPLGLTANH